MAGFPISVVRVNTSTGPQDCVTYMPRDHVFQHGLVPEVILGMVEQPVHAGNPILQQMFRPNPVFVQFLHSVIARRGPGLPGLIAEARRQRDGLIYIIDHRTKHPEGPIPPHDIVGAFAVQGGAIVPGSYQGSPKHQILSVDGFLQLGPEMLACLIEEATYLRQVR